MSKIKLWDLHLKYDGPVTEEFIKGNKQLAQSIASEPGIIWKIWTHEKGTNHYGSTYLFTDLDSLNTYRKKHIKRLNDIGIHEITDYIFDVMEDESLINHAPLQRRH